MQHKLGAFSISLNVKDIQVSKEFYEKLGFEVFGGGLAQRYLIMKSGDTLIGLFQGMFEKNILTFNPGWDVNAQPLESFDDIRALQQEFQSKGLEIENAIPAGTSGPASFLLTDPDGNPILFDQHR